MGPSGRKIRMHIWLYAGTSCEIRNDRNGKTIALRNVCCSQDNQQGRLLQLVPSTTTCRIPLMGNNIV